MPYEKETLSKYVPPDLLRTVPEYAPPFSALIKEKIGVSITSVKLRVNELIREQSQIPQELKFSIHGLVKDNYQEFDTNN